MANGGTRWVEVAAYIGVGAVAGYFLLGDGKDMLEGIVTGEEALQTDEPTVDAVAPELGVSPETTTALLGPGAAGTAAVGRFGSYMSGGNRCRCVKKKCGRPYRQPHRPSFGGGGGWGGFFWPGFPFQPRPRNWGYPGYRPPVHRPAPWSWPWQRPGPFPRPRPGFPPRHGPRPGPWIPPRPRPGPFPRPRPGFPPGPRPGPFPRPPHGGSPRPWPPRPPGGPLPGMPGPPPGPPAPVPQ